MLLLFALKLKLQPVEKNAISLLLNDAYDNSWRRVFSIFYRLGDVSPYIAIIQEAFFFRNPLCIEYKFFSCSEYSLH